MNKSAAIIGLGVLGSAIAEYLLKCDFEIHGFDISLGALSKFDSFENFHSCSSVSDIFLRQENILLCLPSPANLDAVMQEIPSQKDLNKIADSNVPLLIELSTLPVDAKQNAFTLARDKQIRMVDSPVSGNRIVALQGKLSAYLSGNEEDVRAAKPVLEAFCQKVTEVGAFGNGSKMKLIGNILNLSLIHI